MLPAGLVFGHPGYLRPLKGYQPLGGNFLHIVAVDLAHTLEGGWTVMAHRTETPSGMGYALENRLIISSLFADAFRELRVRRLPAAFSQLVATLAQQPAAQPPAPESSGSAAASVSKHIVLLTPGPYNETYFEHTFLARYLGITLVEGKDLTVRNDVVYLKTLAGLERVDVVLRRLDDAYCDPVELRQDSTLGVPGLLQAMRAGNVLVSNAPGSGFLETPAIHGFLPAISRALLGEELLLPGVPSWWCGEATAREEALGEFTEAFLMPTYPRGMAQPWEGPRLGMERGLQRLADWRERIEQVPDLFTIQADLPLSHAPRWEGPHIGSRAAMLRVYAIADGRGGWQVMPGGFTRLAGEGSRRYRCSSAAPASTPGCCRASRRSRLARRCSSPWPARRAGRRPSRWRYPAAPPRTCSGPAAMPSVRKTTYVCAAWCWARSKAATTATTARST